MGERVTKEQILRFRNRVEGKPCTRLTLEKVKYKNETAKHRCNDPLTGEFVEVYEPPLTP
jgi:hypothetical protein